MLAHLVAAGILSATGGSTGTGTFIASPDRTASVAPGAGGGAGDGLPIGAASWTIPLDPADHAPYVFDWTALLGADTIASISRITVSASAVALGVQVDTDPTHAPAIDGTGKQVSLWLEVASGYQTSAAFSGAGVQVGIAMLVTTTATPPRSYERTMILTVRQQ